MTIEICFGLQSQSLCEALNKSNWWSEDQKQTIRRKESPNQPIWEPLKSQLPKWKRKRELVTFTGRCCLFESVVKVKLLLHVWLFATPWTLAYRAPPSMGFSQQRYWSGLPFPSPEDLPNTGIEPRSTCIAGRHFILWATREASSRLFNIRLQDLSFSRFIVRNKIRNEIEECEHKIQHTHFYYCLPFVTMSTLLPCFVSTFQISHKFLSWPSPTRQQLRKESLLTLSFSFTQKWEFIVHITTTCPLSTWSPYIPLVIIFNFQIKQF